MRRAVLVSLVALAIIGGVTVTLAAWLLTWKDPISDNPCEIVDVEVTGHLTVRPIIRNGRRVEGAHRGVLREIGLLEESEVNLLKQFIANRVDGGIVCAAQCEDGVFDIIFLDEPSGRVLNLNEEFLGVLRQGRYLSEE